MLQANYRRAIDLPEAGPWPLRIAIDGEVIFSCGVNGDSHLHLQGEVTMNRDCEEFSLKFSGITVTIRRHIDLHVALEGPAREVHDEIKTDRHNTMMVAIDIETKEQASTRTD
jgi:hypothetical protein